MDKVNVLAAEELRRIESWKEAQRKRIEKRISWNNEALRNWMWSTNKKTVSLPSGTLRRRVGRDRIDVVLEETFLQWAENAGLDALMRVRRSPNKKAITAYVKETGEEPPGVELNRASDTFSVDVS